MILIFSDFCDITYLNTEYIEIQFYSLPILGFATEF